MDRIVVADAGPIIHLSEVGAIDLIISLGEVIVPTAVALECRKHIPLKSWESYVSVKQLDSSQSINAEMLCKVAGLHKGEAEAIVLAELLPHTIFITDDAAARFYAASLEIEVRGTLGIVLAAVAIKKITSNHGFFILKELRNSSLWISDKVYNKALNAVKELSDN